MLPNLLQYPVAFFGVLCAGLVVVNVNPFCPASELQQRLVDSGARGIIVLEGATHTLQEIIRTTDLHLVVTTNVGDLLPPLRGCLMSLMAKWIGHGVRNSSLSGEIRLRTALRRGHNRALEKPELKPADIALLQYTSGTTGTPKGVVLTHGNLLANVEQISAWLGSVLDAGSEVVVTPLPLYHIFALTANMLTFVRWGGNNVLILDPRDSHALLRTLRTTRFTAISGVDTLFRRLLDAPGFEAACAANRGVLKLAVAGGMAVTPEVAQRWLQATGIALTEGYGLTEAAPVVCVGAVDGRMREGMIGMPLPSTRVEIRDETGRALPPGQAGEICVQGPQVMRGYWNLPAQTASVLDAAGWLRTGDLGKMDALGSFRFLARCAEVIVVSGFKVYPKEVEEVAMQHPGVRDACAVAVTDARSGEAVKLLVVRHDPTLSAGALIAHCRARLIAYKVPRHIEFRTELVHSELGKHRIGPGLVAPKSHRGDAAGDPDERDE
ncbi:long-chain-fatty-acid--CoA ligase (plasmid) [Cupriavidus sp. USMAHM13]|nr:long-chain-fatty-acid--CoA ligase [Cupriavidus sp. USMAHM13]